LDRRNEGFPRNARVAEDTPPDFSLTSFHGISCHDEWLQPDIFASTLTEKVKSQAGAFWGNGCGAPKSAVGYAPN
jgi:hypothetical protein